MDQNLVSRPVRMPEGDAATELFHSGGEDSVRLKLDYVLFPVFMKVDWGDFIVRDVEIAKEIVASWEPEFAPRDAAWNFGEIESVFFRTNNGMMGFESGMIWWEGWI